MRGRETKDACTPVCPAEAVVPSHTLRALPLPLSLDMCLAKIPSGYIRERSWMWVSVLRAKVKPVAGVVEVGRIRVTDQRAPREPAPGKPPQRGGCGGALGLIESAYREQNARSVYPTILPACLSSFLRSFSSFLRSLLSVSLSHRIISSPPFLPESVSVLLLS